MIYLHDFIKQQGGIVKDEKGEVVASYNAETDACIFTKDVLAGTLLRIEIPPFVAPFRLLKG